MKITRIREFGNEDTTMTLRIIEGETCEGTIVTERQATEKVDTEFSKAGDTIIHVTLESPSLENQVYRTLEELAAENDEESVEVKILNLVEADLIDELVFVDPADDALELSLLDN